MLLLLPLFRRTVNAPDVLFPFFPYPAAKTGTCIPHAFHAMEGIECRNNRSTHSPELRPWWVQGYMGAGELAALRFFSLHGFPDRHPALAAAGGEHSGRMKGMLR